MQQGSKRKWKIHRIPRSGFREMGRTVPCTLRTRAKSQVIHKGFIPWGRLADYVTCARGEPFPHTVLGEGSAPGAGINSVAATELARRLLACIPRMVVCASCVSHRCSPRWCMPGWMHSRPITGSFALARGGHRLRAPPRHSQCAAARPCAPPTPRPHAPHRQGPRTYRGLAP